MTQTMQSASGTVNRTGPIISLIGGALLLIGSLMEWATVSTDVGTISIASTDADGEIMLFCGVVILVLALLDLALPRPWWWIGVGVLGTFALFIAVINFINVTDGIVVEEGADVSISAGLYVVLLGAVAAFAGALIRERSVRPVTADGPPPT
jgi:hypothetical protein